MQTTLFEVIGRTAAIYVMLYVSLRVMGKREVSQFTPFDLILLLTLANGVQNAMVGDNISLAGGFAAALTLLLMNFLLNDILSRHLKMRHWLEGSPTLLMRHGKVELAAMKREHLDMEALLTAIREHGLEGVHEVDLAVLELDGSISVVGNHAGDKKKPALKNRRRRSRFTKLR